MAEVGPVVELDFDRSNTGSPSIRKVLIGKFIVLIACAEGGCCVIDVDLLRVVD